jgi:hypothetical protein
MTILTQVAATLASYGFAVAQANQENSSEQIAAQNSMSAAQFFFLCSGIALGTLAFIGCTHDSKRLKEEMRQSEAHRRQVTHVSLFGPKGTDRPPASTFAHTRRDEYDAAVALYKKNDPASRRSFR